MALKKTGLNLKQKSDPNRNPSQFPIIFLRSTCYFLLLLYLFLGRYRVNKSELRFCTSHVTPFMRFIESRLSWLAGFLPSEHLVFCNHILLAFSRTHDETKTEKTVWIPTSKQEWDEKSTFLQGNFYRKILFSSVGWSHRCCLANSIINSGTSNV